MDILSDHTTNEDPEAYNEKKRKILGDEIFDSFMHPKQIKTGKIVLKPETSNESKPKSFSKIVEQKTERKSVKHKFNVV